MKKYILSTIIFSFFFIFFTSFSELKSSIPNELNEQKQLFNFYKHVYPYISDITLVKIMYWTKYYNLNLSETMSFIKIESNFDQYAKGYNFTEKAIYDEDGGIVGIRKQLVSMDIGLCQNNNVYHYVENPFNIDVNLRTGLTYFKECIDKSNGNFRIALQRYNCGDWNTDHNITPYSTIIYVKRVLNEKIKIIFYS